MKAIIVTVGDEILIGQIVDTNSAWLGQQLQYLGINVIEGRSIPDEISVIESTLADAFEKADLILMTGGLGPTKDDMTKKAIANYFGSELFFHEPTWERVENYANKIGFPLTPAHREQCFMPEQVEILINKMGTAPGMLFKKGEQLLISMPGVPHEMKWIVENQLIPKLKELSDVKIAHRTILTIGEGESRIAQKIEDIEEDLPANVKLAFLPGFGKVRLRLSAMGTKQSEVDALVESQKRRIEDRIPQLIYGYETEELTVKIGELLQAKGWMLGLAESCTGGHLAESFTAHPGSSAYFQGGVIAYANEVKKSLLNVTQDTLDKHGAVSEATVQEMLLGSIDALDVQVAVATSGIAGPGGGTAEKPVGTIWIAVGNKERIITHKLTLGKSRRVNIQYTAIKALDLLRKFILAD